MLGKQQSFYRAGLTALVIASALFGQEARAQVVGVVSRPSGDTVNWGQLNLAPGTDFPTPERFTSFGGIEGEATVDKNGLALIQEQCCPSGNWDGNFNPGDILFDTKQRGSEANPRLQKTVESHWDATPSK